MTKIGFVEGVGLGIKVFESGRRRGLGVCRRSRLVLRVRNRNLDDVRLDEKEDDDDVQEGSGLEDSDVIIVSRRELLAAFLAAFMFASTILAAQRHSSIRRWSFAAFSGVLRERYPPTSGNSVALARFMMEGIKSGPISNLKNLSWINVQPPRLKDRLLLVHIWRISDVRTTDVMTRLEKVIIGMKKELFGAVATLSVHCAKFNSERIPPFIQEAAEEMRWRHSVASDTDLSLWKSIGAEVWPTVLILSPNDHRVLVALTGDTIGRLEECLYASLSLYKKAQLQTSSFPLPKVMKPSMTWDSPLLRYPSRIAMDAKGGRLFISDSGNSRILVTTLEGRFLMQIGGAARTDPMDAEVAQHVLYSEGENEGFRDGSFQDALFRNPQGIAFNALKNELAVADTGNNCLRIANLEERSVRSVNFVSSIKDAGEVAKELTTKRMTSPKPWDVSVSSGNVYISLAGSNTIWRLDPFGDMIHFCGRTGVAGRVDVESGYGGALFASPSGLCATQSSLFVVDSDSSTVREIGLGEKSVRTVVGGDSIFLGNLSAFGDRDGFGSGARLQMPMGICSAPEDKLLVADSYNNKIRSVVPSENECREFSGTGLTGYRDGPKEVARFFCPTDVVYSDKLKKAYVTDKNNHQIRVIDGVTGDVSTLRFFGFPDFGEAAETPSTTAPS